MPFYSVKQVSPVLSIRGRARRGGQSARSEAVSRIHRSALIYETHSAGARSGAETRAGDAIRVASTMASSVAT